MMEGWVTKWLIFLVTFLLLLPSARSNLSALGDSRTSGSNFTHSYGLGPPPLPASASFLLSNSCLILMCVDSRTERDELNAKTSAG